MTTMLMRDDDLLAAELNNFISGFLLLVGLIACFPCCHEIFLFLFKQS